ncbi:MAG: endoglucanase [Thermoleophilaceae bacterium]|jgi:endoglucanase|nr:endoglucanase [Thermoleophilaceae bacterium]
MKKLLVTLLLTGATLVAAVSPAAAWNSANPTSGPDNPLANQNWFVDWQWGMSQRQYLEYVTNGHLDRLDRVVHGPSVELLRGDERNAAKDAMWPILQRTDPYSFLPEVSPQNQDKARLMLKIARNPQTFRPGDHPYAETRGYLDRMEEANPGALAFLYLYHFPHRYANMKTHAGGICGNFDQDGPSFDAKYRAWIDSVASAIGSRHVAVFLEPDGLMTMHCLTKRAQRSRYALFNYGVDKLGAKPNAAVYIDAGHSGWFGKKDKIRQKVAALRRAGVLKARGFFLNSTGYNRTSVEVAHGNQLVRMLGGKPRFIVSTAVNGRGPYRVRGRGLRYDEEQRCNPPGRALGPEPTVTTTSPYADAFAWIGDPGRSGAACHQPGQPQAPKGGAWWEWYALDLARNTGWQ